MDLFCLIITLLIRPVTALRDTKHINEYLKIKFSLISILITISMNVGPLIVFIFQHRTHLCACK